jgi:hypothetical protein
MNYTDTPHSYKQYKHTHVNTAYLNEYFRIDGYLYQYFRINGNRVDESWDLMKSSMLAHSSPLSYKNLQSYHSSFARGGATTRAS